MLIFLRMGSASPAASPAGGWKERTSDRPRVILPFLAGSVTRKYRSDQYPVCVHRFPTQLRLGPSPKRRQHYMYVQRPSRTQELVCSLAAGDTKSASAPFQVGAPPRDPRTAQAAPPPANFPHSRVPHSFADASTILPPRYPCQFLHLPEGGALAISAGTSPTGMSGNIRDITLSGSSSGLGLGLGRAGRDAVGPEREDERVSRLRIWLVEPESGQWVQAVRDPARMAGCRGPEWMGRRGMVSPRRWEECPRERACFV
ncbi:hypothetical protein VUR80DRAFT_6593 [Thermomyces stellatus]